MCIETGSFSLTGWDLVPLPSLSTTPFLRRACEARLAVGVAPRNMLRTLEVAELSSSAALMERAMGAVVEHAEEVVFSAEYERFAARNAGLCVEITRALLARMPTAARSDGARA
jgi:speckle-type POZ protein